MVVKFSWIQIHQLQGGGSSSSELESLTNHQLQGGGCSSELHSDTNHQLWGGGCRLGVVNFSRFRVIHQLQGGGCSACAPANIAIAHKKRL